jgi:GrpB-like predicted nucleotidyltransferase (UPF0157 family)
MKTEVAPYNKEWKKWYLELKTQIWPVISDIASDIIHVGSTSIEGMSAKPIIDIDIVVENFDELELFKEKLREIGYHHIGNLGIKDREAFKTEREPLHPHNLYLVLRDSTAFRNHILLKKHIEENPESFKKYNKLKIKLANSASSIDEYTRSKTLLILEFLKVEGVSQSEIEQIKGENL